MFTYRHYKETCLEYLRQGYAFSSLDSRPAGKSIWMVHDCDSFLENALRLARHENEVGISSTYFLRFGARAYNVLSPYSVNICKKITDYGHTLGLHYEPLAGLTINDMIDLLSSTIGKDINYFNVHEPARTGVNISTILPEKNRCYNAPFFSDVKYISDSGGRWREGCFSEHINRWDNLLVSTHPVWWYETSPAENY